MTVSAHAAFHFKRHRTEVLLLLLEIRLRGDQALAAEIHSAGLRDRILEECSASRIHRLPLPLFGAGPWKPFTISWTTEARSTSTSVAHGLNESGSHGGEGWWHPPATNLYTCGRHYETGTRTNIVDACTSYKNLVPAAEWDIRKRSRTLTE